MSDVNEDLKRAALYYHKNPKPGKMEIRSTKALGSQRDLSLAYSPGVAAPCLAISEDRLLVSDYTNRGNLVAVITNGTAVLGLGNIGPMAAKPVMEGKAVLFKKFADIDVFDIEVDCTDIESFVQTVRNLEPTFGGINLEDIKAPECFEIEEKLQKSLKTPVFHDDQHGTAIIVCAAILNGLDLAGKHLDKVKIVVSGAGAAALACLNLLCKLGAKKDNIWVTDIEGGVYIGREAQMDKWKAAYAQGDTAWGLGDVIEGADIFLGLSAANVLKPEMVAKMATTPLILALANPDPEIMPEVVRGVRPDAMICTGRSDYPNQVNNVLCFPYIFRGALDVGATQINDEMKLSAVEAIANLAREVTLDNKAIGRQQRRYGADNLIPSPFDPRLLLRIAPAVAKAAMDTGVATRPIEDMPAYIEKLNRHVYRSGLIMKPMFVAAKESGFKRVIYSDGEDERVLRAAKASVDEGLAFPILVGRPSIIAENLDKLGIKMKENKDYVICHPSENVKYEEYVDLYIKLAGRSGVTMDAARRGVSSSCSIFSALALMNGDADAMLCGLSDTYSKSIAIVEKIVGIVEKKKKLAALSLLVMSDNVLFLTDTQINYELSAQEIADLTILAAEKVRGFGIEPKAALLSHSNFGTADTPSAIKMREAVDIIKATAPRLEVDGEMHGDAALNEELRLRRFNYSSLQGSANLLVFPNLDAASIAMNIVQQTSNALHVGPILLGARRSVHILTPSITSRGVLNMTAIAVFDAIRKPLQF